MQETALWFRPVNAGIDKVMKIFNCVASCEFMILRLCMNCSPERENIVKGAFCVCPTAHCQSAAESSALRSGKFSLEPPPADFENAGLRKAADAPVQIQPMKEHYNNHTSLLLQ
jgi:hypothetical protein